MTLADKKSNPLSTLTHTGKLPWQTLRTETTYHHDFLPHHPSYVRAPKNEKKNHALLHPTTLTSTAHADFVPKDMRANANAALAAAINKRTIPAPQASSSKTKPKPKPKALPFETLSQYGADFHTFAPETMHKARATSAQPPRSIAPSKMAKMIGEAPFATSLYSESYHVHKDAPRSRLVAPRVTAAVEANRVPLGSGTTFRDAYGSEALALQANRFAHTNLASGGTTLKRTYAALIPVPGRNTGKSRPPFATSEGWYGKSLYKEDIDKEGQLMFEVLRQQETRPTMRSLIRGF